MAEVWFYHLTRQSLEAALPGLLERSLSRGWRAVVQSGGQDRLDALDAALWTYSDESFLAHGSARDGDADLQPVWLTTGQDNPNGAKVRFFVDGALPSAAQAGDEALDRLVLMFDGRDEDMTQAARACWKTLKDAGLQLSYWQQAETGGWEKKA